MALTAKLFRRQIIEAARASEPVTPRCGHAPPLGLCGGCVFQERSYDAQIAAKHAALRDLWASELPAEAVERIEMVASPNPFEYRTRMDYVASKDRFGLRRGGKFNYIIDLAECHLIPPAAFTAARAVYERAIALGLPDYNLKSHAGFLRYIVVRRSPQGLLLLAAITAAPNEAGVHTTAIEQLAEHALVQPSVVGFHWLINDTLTDISFGAPFRHWGAATLPMQVGAHKLSIGPNSFFQNNVHLLLPMLDDVVALATDRAAAAQHGGTKSGADVVADLYSGVGTIALHLANHVARVVSIESVEESARLAEHNVAANGISKIDVIASDVLAFLRQQLAGRFDVIVADPPRTGLGPEVCQEILRLRPQRLVCVSCNPLTQLEDARVLAPGYSITALRGYDMFPQTAHLETIGVFDHKPDSQ